MTGAPASNLPFDRVIINSNGDRRELTVDEFLQLPLDLRIHYVLARAVDFYRGMVPVDRKIALSCLRATSSQSS